MPAFKDTGDKFPASIDPAEVAYVEGVLGPEWTYILREENNYSGLSIADLGRVYVGDFDSDGFVVDGCGDDDPVDFLGLASSVPPRTS